jgi:hypothetical protein
MQFGQTNFSGVGSGTSLDPVAMPTAGKVNTSYATCAATGGDTRNTYLNLIFTAAGSGETLRAYTHIATGATGVAPGGTVNGAHVSLDIDGTATVSGAGNALRATIGGSSTNPGGTLAAIQVDSNFATGGTWTNATFLRFTNSGSGSVAALAKIPAPSNGTMFATHVTDAMTHSIKILDSAGVAYYIACTTTATNRG